MSDTEDRGNRGAIVPVLAVARRPHLWGEALRSLIALAPDRWWTRRPFVPAPEPSYLAWRTATAYGSPDATIDPDDVVAYLEWRRMFRKATAS
jgi:hypothetical protein